MDNKKWTKKYLLLIWLITLIVVVVAICGHVFRIGALWGMGFGNLKTVEESYDFSNEKIADLVIDMNAADINIQYGSDFTVIATFPEKYTPKVELNDSKLRIVQKQNINNIGGFKGCHLDIIIPEGTSLDSVKINAAAGDINIQDIRVDKLSVDANAGDIDINYMKVDTIKVNANAGDIDINYMTADAIIIDADAGDINVMSGTADSIEVNVSAGDVDITGDYEKIDCDCAFGDIDIDAPNTDRNNIDVDCSFGSANVNGK